MEYSVAVVARKFTLKTKKDNKWNINCPARVDGGTKVHPREFIEGINSIDNNVHYVIDEEATAIYLENLEERIQAAKEKKAIAAMTPAEILRESINREPAKPKKSPTPQPTTSKPTPVAPVEEKTETTEETIIRLRGECDAKGIPYHERAGVKKLTELLNK